MFKLKPGNVFQKINKMDRKQAYTLGAIVVVVFVALITMASFLGKADDSSFDGFNSRGYDLAQMPFVNDEAEEYLLASKYPDMQGNNSTMLYSSDEKEERQAEDAAQAEEEAAGDTSSDTASADSSYSGYSGRGYSGRGGARTPTQIGQLGSASMRGSGGSGISATWGAPKGDFSPYKSQDKGTETPLQLKNTDAKKALSQFARGSAAAAGLKEGKSINAKRALMGAGIKGSEAFSETGAVDLSKAGGLNLDTNAPVSSADLSNLDKKVSEAAKKGKEEKKKEDEKFGNTLANDLWKQVLTKAVDLGMQQLSEGIDTWMANLSANKAGNNYAAEIGKEILSKDISKLTPEEKSLFASAMGTTADKLPSSGSARSLYRQSTGAEAPAQPDRNNSKYTVSDSERQSNTSSGSDESSAETFNEKAYNKDMKRYNKQLRDEEADFGKAMRPALTKGSGVISRQYQSTRVSAYNSRAKHSKQEVVPVQGDSKSGFEEDERKMAELRKKMESYKKEALNELEQEAKRERELHERQEQERIRKYGLQRA